MDHIAVDLGGRESQICVCSATGEVLLERRIQTSKLKGFLRQRPRSRVILETCAEAFAVACQAQDAGHEVRVVPATLVKSLGVGHRGIKTDQRDARALCEASTRVELLASVHIPSEFSRTMRACVGMRASLVKARTQLVNNVRGWLRGELIQGLSGSTEHFSARVNAYFGEKKLPIPPFVQRQLESIDSLTAQLELADMDVELLSKQVDGCQRLMTVPGVGPVTAVRFMAAVDSVGRFVNAHRLESYFGLTPGESSSSDSKYRTGLTKAGSSEVRHLMIEAAWCAYRTRPNDPMVLWTKKLAGESDSRRHVAVTALARKMVGIMFALLRDNTNYDPAKASIIRTERRRAKRAAKLEEVLQEARTVYSEDEPMVSHEGETKSRRGHRRN